MERPKTLNLNDFWMVRELNNSLYLEIIYISGSRQIMFTFIDHPDEVGYESYSFHINITSINEVQDMLNAVMTSLRLRKHFSEVDK